MKTYIKNLKELQYLTGLYIEPEEIGYGEKAVKFQESQYTDVSDFLEHGEFGTCFLYENTWLCKVYDNSNNTLIVYENDSGKVCVF